MEHAQFELLADLTQLLAADGAPGWTAVRALALAELGASTDAVTLATSVLEGLDAPDAVRLGTPDERDVVGVIAAEVAAITGDRRLAAARRGQSSRTARDASPSSSTPP